MAQQSESQPNYRHSLLDRLIGLPDGRGRKPPSGRVRSRREDRIRRQFDKDPDELYREVGFLDWIIAAVKEDLRCLLNATRPMVFEHVGENDPLHRSLWTYGLMDMSDQTPVGVVSGNLLPDAVRDAVMRFEPRLRDVEVLVESDNPAEPMIRLRIKAKLLIDPGGTQPVTLDTLMWLGSRRIDVNGGLDGREADSPLSARA